MSHAANIVGLDPREATRVRSYRNRAISLRMAAGRTRFAEARIELLTLARRYELLAHRIETPLFTAPLDRAHRRRLTA
jgi:hypothetical protein